MSLASELRELEQDIHYTMRDLIIGVDELATAFEKTGNFTVAAALRELINPVYQLKRQAISVLFPVIEDLESSGE